MKKLLFLFCIAISVSNSKAQVLDFALAAKNEFSPSFSYEKTYGLGLNKRFQIGWGIRANSYFSGKKPFITAPAELTSGKKSIAAFFTEYRPEYLDTLQLTKAAVVSINSKIVLQYKFKKSEIGFNIDALGFSLGAMQSGTFFAKESTTFNKSQQTAKPTGINILLISDSDRGSLNSELYYRHWIKNKSALRVGISFQFIEYTTSNKLTFENDRFRAKTLMPFIAYSFKPFK
jgi:hypothetical protein